MDEKIFAAESRLDLQRCFPVVKLLRPLLSIDDYLSIYEEAHRNDGFKIVAVEKDSKILAVMGYRVLTDFVRGKHIYIDDLVSVRRN